MKKTLISAPILSKIKKINHNGAIFTIIRQFFDNSSNSKKMHQQQQQQQQKPDQGHTFFKTTNNNSNVQQQEGDTLHKFRKWIKIIPTSEKTGQTFTILNYNILSQKLLEQHSYLYHRHDGYALAWDKRLYNVIGEIFQTNPSILCFQEVQFSHMYQIQNRLSRMNYEMIFKKRTGDKPDGCAIFFRKNLFQLVDEYNVEFEQPGIELLNRENVAIIAKLCLRSNPSVQFVVATTHLLYNPRRQDIRLAQVQVLLAELDRHAQVVDATTGQKTYLPVVLTGDFNLQPYSAPFNLITNGSLKYEHLTPKTLIQPQSSVVTNGRKLLPIILGISDECQHYKSEIKLFHSEHRKIVQHDQNVELTKETVNFFQTGILRHTFDFKSVYHHLNENYVSTHQNQWILVDYMFYADETKKTMNSNELQLLGYLSLPTAAECESIKLKIPNSYSGSDHLSLFAEFKLCYESNQNNSNENEAPTTTSKNLNKL